jgi:hypothetical protein
LVWWAWLALLVAVALSGAIAVAVQRSGRARGVSAWLGAVAFYAVLVGMFGDFWRAALAEGSTRGKIGFGFLTGFFTIGLLVALVRTAAAARDRAPGDAGATH